MARNKVMQLWTAIVTAFLALCTALGLVTAAPAAATAAPRTESPNSDSVPHRTVPTTPVMTHWSRPWSHARALPPTMKQRIRAEAHGKSPSCRHRPLARPLAKPLAKPLTDPAAKPLTDPLTETEEEGAGSLSRSALALAC
ncbi:DUF6344 domain-containing protein [Streptomyces sp. NK08204]|uniref:DUF6344 domain-containing protein n=1 Tax=Streptomyces sp. NK08204 TaxID=2873260 RepID=UPI001CEDC2B2|nr:DUF6344 domain-containing protein [Streptomyces sp. NK08204]